MLTTSPDDQNVNTPLAATYYAQRASTPGTLLITEAAFISPQAGGYDSVPGLWDSAQLARWKTITDAVHAKGSYIYAQLWALGRAGGAKVLAKRGLDVVSSSAVPINEKSSMPREMTDGEVWSMVGAYADAAKKAVEEAGFDGVEIHGANGYLVDQFTQDNCNRRTDGWGGSVEKRARFGIEVAKAVVKAVGREKVGIRLSPYSEFQGMRMEDPEPGFTYLIKELAKLELVYLHMTTPRVQGGVDVAHPTDDMGWAVEAWGKTRPLILAGGFTAQTAEEEVEKVYPGYNIAIAFGRYFISTPDLPFRIREGIAFNKYDRPTFYTKGEKGYTDYPFSQEWEQAQARL
ncbi:FMN-linked oxidoreductase [Microthyrium microscopicum]|uniref:FMN-linked oxidoreductase n=1 Tax=Microthyrium microscopicum TaxID=703497 RepID=A0A6A6UAL7_9PEZI|nr:FMN-linked oxidoreductase [Microthyrium microscopicum]